MPTIVRGHRNRPPHLCLVQTVNGVAQSSNPIAPLRDGSSLFEVLCVISHVESANDGGLKLLFRSMDGLFSAVQLVCLCD